MKRRIYAANIARFDTPFDARGISLDYDFEIHDPGNPITISQIGTCALKNRQSQQQSQGDVKLEDLQDLDVFDVYDVDTTTSDDQLKPYPNLFPFSRGIVHKSTRHCLYRLLVILPQRSPELPTLSTAPGASTNEREQAALRLDTQGGRGSALYFLIGSQPGKMKKPYKSSGTQILTRGWCSAR